jgi:hypothetical protein
MSAAQKVEECWDKCDDADSIMATCSGAAPMDVLSNDSMVPATIHVRGDQPFSTLDAFIAGVSIELLSWYSRHPDKLARDCQGTSLGQRELDDRVHSQSNQASPSHASCSPDSEREVQELPVKGVAAIHAQLGSNRKRRTGNLPPSRIHSTSPKRDQLYARIYFSRDRVTGKNYSTFCVVYL